MGKKGTFLGRVFEGLFYMHIGLVIVLVIFLMFRGMLSADHGIHGHVFQPKIWYPLAFSSSACAGLVGFLWQSFTAYNPSRAFRATFWMSPLLTCALGILLALIETPGSLAASIVVIISSALQSLYGCWINPRVELAVKILTLSTACCPPKVQDMVALSVIISTLYSSFLMSGIGGAVAARTKFDSLFIFAILGSLTWTLQIIKNMMQVAVSHVKYKRFACAMDVEFKEAVKNAVMFSMGSVCIGSIVVPVVAVVRGIAHAVSWIAGDVDEFMLSCADCCSGVESRIVVYGSRWGFVHVGASNKGIVHASIDTWETFKRSGMENLINSDLTSSFCFMSAIAVGSICGLVGGIPALVMDKTCAIEVVVYAFITGYLINRVAMAWIQSSVSAYYVAYAENPQSNQFDSTIPDYIQELQRSRVHIEAEIGDKGVMQQEWDPS